MDLESDEDLDKIFEDISILSEKTNKKPIQERLQISNETPS